MVPSLNKILARVEDAFSFLAALVIMIIMVIVSLDVVMRYAFNRPLGWVYDVISLYLMVGLFYLALSKTQYVGAHINVELLHRNLPRVARLSLNVLIAACSIAFFATIAWLGFDRASSDFISGAATPGQFLFPTWLSTVLVPLGSALISLRLLVSGLQSAIALATGTDLLPDAQDRHHRTEVHSE